LLLEHLQLQDYGRCLPARLFASLLLLAACWQMSLSLLCQQVHNAPSRETVRKALLAALPPRPLTLRDRLLAMLRATLPDHLRGRAVPGVIDLHQRPYYGRSKRGVTRRQKKKSTRKSFTYATLAVIEPWGRFTVGLLLTRPHMNLTTVIAELLRQAAEVGLSWSYLMLDKEFYSAEVIQWLQKHHLPFLMPAQRKGKKVGKGNWQLFERSTAVGWYDYTWTGSVRVYDAKRKKLRSKGEVTVTVQLCVTRGQQSTEGNHVYCCWGMQRLSPARIARLYRQRFGIEAKYRQLGSLLAPTSSRDERVRLLLVGVALLLLNVWEWLHSEVFSSGALGERVQHLHRLRLRAMCKGLESVLVAELGGLITEWPTQRPLPAQLTQDLNC
jgi:hypothetical protein